MESRITLTRNGNVREVRPEDFKNWADIMYSYSRQEYGGVVRKFTSKFEFVGDAYEYLLRLYLSEGVEAKCDLAVYTFTDTWEYEKEFECPLDFSTISWDDNVLNISAVDRSLAAMIKAGKGTKYEMAIGEDITPDGTFRFDRLPMLENAVYSFTQGESDETTGAITVRMEDGELPWLGNVSNEISVGGTIYHKDDQNPDDGGFLLLAKRQAAVDLSWLVDMDTYRSYGVRIVLVAQVVRGAQVMSEHILTDCHNRDLMLGGSTSEYEGMILSDYLGEYQSESELPVPGYGTESVGDWALVGDTVWVVRYNGRGGVWTDTAKNKSEFFRKVQEGSLTISLAPGDKVRIVAVWPQQEGLSVFTLNSSRFTFTWQSVGDTCDIPSFTPERVCKTILEKIADGTENIRVSISDFDSRLAKTRIMCAESIRDMQHPKLYSSFSEFCDWMSAVFGYVYTIDDGIKNEYARIVNVGDKVFTPYDFVSSKYTGEVAPDNIVYVEARNMFFCRIDGVYYVSWNGWEEYMTKYNRPLPDVVYNFPQGSFVYNGRKLVPYEENIDTDVAIVSFVHRSELFSGDVSKVICDANELSYKVNAASIYSTVEIGYDKKDYNSVNGRDEFNFNNTYSTGCTVSEKKLSIISKYRADCYGIEFAAQKRGKDTTDTDSDKDVFFVYCKDVGGVCVPARSLPIEGSLSDRVFNAEFSPMACVAANEDYICMQSGCLTLKFASSASSSNVIIGGTPISADIALESPLMTVGEISFTADDLDVPELNATVEVHSRDVTYVGYISDLDIHIFRDEPAKYKLLVKSIIC